MSIRLCLPFAIAALVASSAAIAQAPQRGNVMEACKSEVASLCGSTGDGRGGAFRCLADNQAKLGADCAAALKVAQDRRVAFQAACKADIDKLCATTGETKGGGRAIACLRGKSAEVSKGCSDMLASTPQAGTKQ